MTKPVLVNTLCWQRTEVVAIPDELWDDLSVEEKSSVSKQSTKDGKTLSKVNKHIHVMSTDVKPHSPKQCPRSKMKQDGDSVNPRRNDLLQVVHRKLTPPLSPLAFCKASLSVYWWSRADSRPYLYFSAPFDFSYQNSFSFIINSKFRDLSEK